LSVINGRVLFSKMSTGLAVLVDGGAASVTCKLNT